MVIKTKIENKLVSTQANNYVYYATLYDYTFSNKVMRALFPIQVLVDGMMNSLSSSITNDIWTLVNGNAGNIKDQLNLSELYIYGSKRIGLLNAPAVPDVKRSASGTIDKIGFYKSLFIELCQKSHLYKKYRYGIKLPDAINIHYGVGDVNYSIIRVRPVPCIC